MAGRDWLIATSLARINGFNRQAIEHFFVCCSPVVSMPPTFRTATKLVFQPWQEFAKSCRQRRRSVDEVAATFHHHRWMHTGEPSHPPAGRACEPQVDRRHGVCQSTWPSSRHVSSSLHPSASTVRPDIV